MINCNALSHLVDGGVGPLVEGQLIFVVVEFILLLISEQNL
jgi:hypothetical protein